MNLIEEAITEHWGERCLDHEPECPVCKAWGQLDNLCREYADMYRTLKRVRNILNVAGYYDDTQAIDDLMKGLHK